MIGMSCYELGMSMRIAKKALLQFVPGNDIVDLEFVDRDGNHLNLSSIKNVFFTWTFGHPGVDLVVMKWII